MERIDPSHQQRMPNRVLIVVTHRLIAEGLEALFRQQADWKVALAANVETALATAEQSRPDVALVDISLPEAGAFLLLRQLQHQSPGVRVVFLDDSVHEGRVAAVQRLRPAGYFTLSDSFVELVAGLRRIVQGEIVYSPGAELFFLPAPPGGLSGVGVPSALSRLTRREMEVLVHLARGLTVKQCAEKLHLSPNTVDNHKARLMNKLGVHRSADLIRLAIREKLIEH